MFDDPRNQCFVFFLGVLFIEDTILCILQSHATETIIGMEALKTIEHETRTPAYHTKSIIGDIDSAIYGLIHEIRVPSNRARIHNILGISEHMLSVFAILRIVRMEALYAVFYIFHIVSRTVFRLCHLSVFLDGGRIESIKLLL